MPTAARRLCAALLLLVALTAVALGPGQSFADYFDDYGDDEAPASDRVALGVYYAELVSGQNVGVDLREAYAYVTPARGGKLRVRVGLQAAARDRARTAAVVAAPCTRFAREDDEFDCPGGAHDRLKLMPGAPQRVTGEVVIPAPRRAIDAIRVRVVVGTSAEPVSLTIPGAAWRGRLAGQGVGGRLADGGGLRTELADLRLETYADGRSELDGSVRLVNAGPKDEARAEASVRRCASPVPACRVDTRVVNVLSDSMDEAQPGADALAKPRGASPVLQLDTRSRPANAVLARVALPWPERVRR